MQIQFNPTLSKNRNNITFTGKRKSQSNAASFINEGRMVDSFVKMAKTDSGSNAELAEKAIPSTPEQRAFAEMLAKELKEMGLTDIQLDQHSILTATFEGNIGKNSPVVGLLAHLDTSPDAPNKGVKPKIHRYAGGHLTLKGGTVISAKDLKGYKGKKIITSDGTTLLGADDKAGIAEILEAIRVFKEHPELKHPKIRIAFTPDEETGMGIHKFNVKRFGADVAYTVDGELPADFNKETFNAFNPKITITGKSIHPGHAYHKMINANLIAQEIIDRLPKNKTPETTRRRQGFMHVHGTQGTVSEATINMLVRDFDYKRAKKNVSLIQQIAKEVAKKHPGCKITVEPNEAYKNMGEQIKGLPEVVKYALSGIRRSGLTPNVKPVRGGTDGSQLSWRGLLAPNLGAGGHNFHSKNEFVGIEDMAKCTENIIHTLTIWAENSAKVMPKVLARRSHL